MAAESKDEYEYPAWYYSAANEVNWVYYQNHDYICTIAEFVKLKQKGCNWRLYIYDSKHPTATVVLKSPDKQCWHALKAFKEWLVKLDRVIPHLPNVVKGVTWACPICKGALYGTKDIRHVEEHLTITKSAGKT
jgi:hypothetical protein